MAEQGGSGTAAAPSGLPPAPAGPAGLEAELVEALASARTELTRIRGNLGLVATFLTRPEQ